MSSSLAVDTVTPASGLTVSSPDTAPSPTVKCEVGDKNLLDNAKVEQDDLSDFELLDNDKAPETYQQGSQEVSDDEDDEDDDFGIVGELYDVVPVRMQPDPSILSDTFYAVYVGRRVGITTESSIASALMTKLPGGSQKSFKTQEGAVAAFNKALMIPGVVRVAYQ